MSAKELSKCATAALAAAACVFVMASVRAADFTPVSASCHPSIDRGACLKHAQFAMGGVETVALLQNGPSNPVSAPCTPRTIEAHASSTSSTAERASNLVK
jgi:hypothetical protein